MQIEGIAATSIDTRARRWIAGPVVQTAQFLFEIVGRDRRADVEFERRCEDARRHGPVPTLEFPGYHAVEVRDPDCNSRGKREAGEGE